FQEDYGLDADGVFGPASWRYLNTNAASRFRSLVINLNRARLLPADFGERYILVNLPSAELYGFEDNDFHTTTMRVVHGKAEKDTHHTPVFRDVMKEVVFGPYWNVPPSIAKKEILPKAQGDWGFLSRNRYEIVSDFNPYNKNTHRLSPQNLELVAQGRLFFRQLPGPTNSLGRVKFLFPNNNNIYMHDTPAKAFFARSNRDYSHGCIRVAKPQELGAYVLGAQGWTSEEVKEAMFAESRKSERVDKDINVYIVYFTTFPRPVFGGKIVMAPGRDVYDLDPRDSKTLSAVLPWVEPDNPTSP
ncbi:MAG: L,D-transpeptidase family protein, partial [Verrucomicrobiales bacterium]|nr:L,D-transpeptidase family protein [Verrucomicrobiales bacterium]